MGEKSQGELIIIGGGEDRDGECIILREVARRAGKEEGKMVILPTAAKNGEKVGQDYQDIFLDLGLGQVDILTVEDREAAQSRDAVRLVESSTAVFFTGGDQLRITSILGGTSLWETLHRSYMEGTLIVGTSAGASAMSDTMIVEGLDDEPPVRCTVKMAPGLGLLEEVVIDQHFAQRGRIGRLLMAVAQNPFVMGLGLDEDTAVLVNEEGVIRVIGSQTAVVIDGSFSEYSNVSLSHGQDPLAFAGVLLHVMPSGYGFHLSRRRFLLPKK